MVDYLTIHSLSTGMLFRVTVTCCSLKVSPRICKRFAITQILPTDQVPVLAPRGAPYNPLLCALPVAVQDQI